jgi:hypothetical protein
LHGLAPECFDVLLARPAGSERCVRLYKVSFSMLSGITHPKHSTLESPYIVQETTDGVLEDLARLDELVREGELARLQAKIEATIEKYSHWGQFEAWWNNPRRTHNLYTRGVGMIYRHDDDFLRALLRDAQHQREDARRTRRPLAEGRTNVQLAWMWLCTYFFDDRTNENWNGGDWQPSDLRGPHRARDE